jgi:hypothetical protein
VKRHAAIPRNLVKNTMMKELRVLYEDCVNFSVDLVTTEYTRTIVLLATENLIIASALFLRVG